MRVWAEARATVRPRHRAGWLCRTENRSESLRGRAGYSAADRRDLRGSLGHAPRRQAGIISIHLRVVLKTPQPTLSRGMQMFFSGNANGWSRRHRLGACFSWTAQSLPLCTGVTSRRRKTTKSLAVPNLSLPGPPRTFSLWSRTQRNTPPRAAGGSVISTSATANLPKGRCSKRASPATRLSKLATLSSPVTRLNAESHRTSQFREHLSVFPAGWLTCEPLATSVRPPSSPMRPARVVRQHGDQLRSPPNGVNQLAGPSWPAPPRTLSPRQGSAPIPRESSAQGCNDEEDFRIPYHPRARPVVIISQMRTSLGKGDADTCRSMIYATLQGEHFQATFEIRPPYPNSLSYPECQTCSGIKRGENF
jgi:hypothetical protein